MLFNTPNSSTVGDTCNLSDFYRRGQNMSIHRRNHFLLKASPPLLPMSYRDLRLVITDQIPSNIVIIPRSLSSCQSLGRKPMTKRRTSEQRKNHKPTGFNVYRSLIRSVPHYRIASNRDSTKNNVTLLTSAFTIDRICLLPNNNSVHNRNPSKIPKYRTNMNNQSKSNRKQKIDSKSLRTSSPPSDTTHRTASSDQIYELEIDKMTSTTKSTSPTPVGSARKQLHVYIPQIPCSSIIDFVTQ